MACFTWTEERILSRRDARMPFAEPGVGPNYGPSRTFDIAGYHLEIHLDPAERAFQGQATIRIAPLPTFTGEVRLDLTDVVVDGVWSLDGTELAWSWGDASLRIQGVTDGLRVRWHGTDPVRGLYFPGPTEREPERAPSAWTQCQDEDAHYFMPCLDHPSVKHPWTIEITGPAGHTHVSNGRMVGSGERDGRSWSRWEQAEPMPAYLFTAVSAELAVVEAAGGPVPVRYLVPPGREGDVALSMGKTPLMIEAFAERTGVPYPWPRYDQVVVHDFIFGGMENVAATTMTDILLVDERGALDWDPDGLVAHELAHQWFGDLLTCQDWSQGWLNESWATFMETVWWEHDRGPLETSWYRFQQAAAYLDEDGSRYRRPIVSYDFREPIDVFDAHLYEKGAVVLATLRHDLGEDAFWAAARLYLTRHAYGTVHTRHLQRAFEDATGRNLDAFFAQWVHSPGHPELEVSVSQEGELLLVSVKQTQSGDGVPEAYHLPLRVEADLPDGTRSLTLPVRERSRTWAVPVTGDVAAVRVDPGFEVLATLSLEAKEPWLVAALQHEAPVLALRAGRALLQKGTRSAVGAVLDAQREHAHWGVRGALAGELAKRGGARVRDALVASLAGEDDPRVRRRVADALGGFRHADVATALLGALDQEPDTWQLHASLLTALGKTRDPRALAVLRSHLDMDSWADQVRQGALKGLAATLDNGVLDDLVAHTTPVHSDRTRAAAVMALAALADRVEGVRDAAVERLVELVDDDAFRVKMFAIRALGRVGEPAALGALARVHAEEGDGRLRRDAYESMARIRRGRTTEAGLESLRRRMEELAEENRKLRARLDKLEPAG